MIGSWGDDSPGTKARRRAMKQSFIAWEQYPDEDCYLITGLYVRPEERRQGKATKMLREALDEMRAERAFDCVRLSADSQAQDSRDPIDEQVLVEFYENEGFNIEWAGEIVVMRYDF
jgi:ribosomal protein S18 acetylase RimI-like enzyme